MKQLFKLIFPYIRKRKLVKYILLGVLSGLWSFLFINMITYVIGLVIAGQYQSISNEYVIIFLSLIVLFIWTRRTLSLGIISLSQKLFWNLRKDIIASVLKADYDQLSKRRIKVHSALTHDAMALTQASSSVVDFTTSFIIAISALIYLSCISFVLFLITLTVATIGVLIYHFGSQTNNRDMEKARILENTFLENYNHIMMGFKEIYMEPKKGKSIYERNIGKVSDDSYKSNTQAFTGYLNNQVTGQIFFYILIFSVLIVFSLILNIEPTDTVRFVFMLLYLLGAIEMIMTLLPTLMKAGVSTKHFMELKHELDSVSLGTVSRSTGVSKSDFKKISVRNLEFHYSEAGTFGIGPIDLDINKGDVIFIYGGNGSGKTTFIHCLLGLIKFSAGEVSLNGVHINRESYSSFRSLFGVVFSDFHLFNELLSVDHPDIQKWEQYLKLFELEGKVKLEDNRFTTTDLSTGQRKRLALIATLMEEKPVLVLDEWAADQDPYFRKKFYTEIIPLLKEQALTLIAITHDDKYYHIADKMYRMDYGKLSRENIEAYSGQVI